MGAEVIKIEPFTGDAARNATIAPLRGESSIHLFMNRGKKSVVLDLKNPEGLEIFYPLVDQADVVIDNFRPGVMARLGIDHESLKKRKPDDHHRFRHRIRRDGPPATVRPSTW